MADWREGDEEQESWPVRFPVKKPPRQASKRFQRRASSRWTGVGRVDTSELRKRFLFLLFAVEVGVVIGAGCVLPLAFLNLPLGEEGVTSAILSEVGAWLGLSRQAICLVVGLPPLILILTIGLNLGLYRWVKGRQDRQ